MTCSSAYGKSNIFAAVVKDSDQEILVIADGAAFGSEMEKMMQLVRNNSHIKLYLPESFEWLILKSGLIEENNIAEILEHPEDQIDCKDYFSWERYFTAMLIQHTQNSYLKYAKKQLNPVYVQKKIMNKILDVMQGINWHR